MQARQRNACSDRPIVGFRDVRDREASQATFVAGVDTRGPTAPLTQVRQIYRHVSGPPSRDALTE